MKSLLRRYSLLISVFITGTAILIVEVLATRILAPHFGNTIFTVSSVIGTVLTALSLGYYIGGIAADKNPAEKIFYLIIFFSGISIFLMRFLMVVFLPQLAYSFSIVSGPLVASLFLFLLPSFLLGLLSPYAVKLQQLRFPKVGIGRLSGEIFFWSTLGSIVGSIGSGFFLIPRFGTNLIIISVACSLVLLGLIGIVISKKSDYKFITFLLILFGLFSLTVSFNEFNNSLFSKEGIYEKIKIFEGVYEGRPTRFFQQDKSSSGAMYLDSDELVYEYTKQFSLYKLIKPAVRNALVLGGGAYSIPKAIKKDLPTAKIDVVEIEPSLYELAKKFFRLKESDGIRNYITDGRNFLNKTNTKYDLIFSDVYYSLYSVPVHFTTKEFFLLSKKKLSQDGVFIANFIGDLKKSKNSLILSEIKTFRTAFPNSYFFALDSPYSNNAQNIIFLGINGNKKPDLDNSTLTSKLIDVNRFDLANYRVLTDDFAPVEYLTSQVIGDIYANEIESFNSTRALNYIKQQLEFGPRYIGSEGQLKAQKSLQEELEKTVDQVVLQKWQHKTWDNKTITLVNIIGRINPNIKDRIILGTHYDTNNRAKYDKLNPLAHVPGANNGASGVAVLLETARYLSANSQSQKVGIDIVFFDGEEGEEDLTKTAWIPIGSTYFVKNINEFYKEDKPKVGVILDMVCDQDLRIERESSSLRNASTQFEEFYEIGKSIAPSVYSGKLSGEIQDDHTPLNEIGIPSFLVIDFDYPYIYTTEDTFDKCSVESLKVVGETLIKYIYTL